MSAFLQNTAGEVEREARSRRTNVIEALAIASGIFFVLWPVCFGIGVLGETGSMKEVAQVFFVALFGWVMLGSPLLHRDAATSLGLGNPVQLWCTLRSGSVSSRWRVLAPALAIFSIFFLSSVACWPDTAKLFRLGSEARYWPIQPGGAPKVFAFSGLVSVVLTTCLVRYDNLFTSLRPILIASGALLAYALAGAWLNHGRAAFERIDPAQYPFDVLAYALWGMTQQFVFTSWFSTRLRKGVAPLTLKSDARTARPLRNPVWLGGVLGSLAMAPPMWIAIRMLSGAEQAPAVMLLWFLIFAFPVGAVWMHFYRRNPRRLLVATLSGSFFGLIHIDSYGLVIVTFWLGTIFAYLFMEDRFRNLAVIGFAHGLLGSTFGKFFKTEAAGPLQISYRVGPWSVEEPAAHVLVIPMLCLGLYLTLLVWALRSGSLRQSSDLTFGGNGSSLAKDAALPIAVAEEAQTHT